MAEQDFDNFNQRLREWMDSHADEYDAFEAGMNRRDNFGYQTILAIAMGFAPQYEKIVSRRVNRSPDDNITDIEQLFVKNELAETLTAWLGNDFTKTAIGSFDGVPDESIIPAMLSWLYFGQSFERMVERGEEIRRNPDIPYHEKMLIVQAIKMLVDQSIESGLRNKENWVKHHRLMQLADGKDTLGWVLTEEEQPAEESRKPGRPVTASPLTEMFSSSITNKKKLLEKIGDYLITKHSQSDIARLKITLDELRFLVSPVNIKPFRDALAEQYGPGIHIIHERGVQEAYSRLTNTISTKGKLVADIGEDRSAIDEIKNFLRN